ncbi:MAG: alpha-glucan family phosphorylase, partial [Flavobacteriales bacterium]
REKVDTLLALKARSFSEPTWFQENRPNCDLSCVAYFSMEFMLSEALHIYVGGLGNVAGDQMKSASDLGVPVVAIGILYQQGYFRQVIDRNGTQQAYFPYNDPGQLPVTPLRLPNGEWLRLKIKISDHTVWLRTWQVQVGRVKLYLLDSNDPSNLPIDRGITSEVYGGGQDLRIQQEIILGIGGWKLLRALNIKPEVCHLNEGHAAFLILERAKDFMKETGVTFESALSVTRAGNIFTTHTAVSAGFDCFDPSLMWRFFAEYAKNELDLHFDELMALGRENPLNFSEGFNMALLAIHGSGAVNGVSRLHGTVSRQLFRNLFPRWPIAEVPVGHVTNGVHMPAWDSEFADRIWTKACGKERWRGDLTHVEKHIFGVSDADLWQLRNDSRNQLVNYVRQRFENQSLVSTEGSNLMAMAKDVFDPNTLTLGFARRFVPYKRPNLLLYDKERLVRLLTNPEHPVQLVVAGKAPPYDEASKDLIRQWVQFIQQYNVYRHVVFLSDCDMLLTEQLVQGADLWINTPRRPWEACGTSGMKVLVNGGINLSELDGWWAEAYAPEVGWALGDGQEHDNDPSRDYAEAERLYSLLEQEVVPAFYDRDVDGIPQQWTTKMRHSMKLLTPQFSSNRTVREYTDHYYLPAATNFKKRAENKGLLGKKIVVVQQEHRSNWGQIHFGESQITEDLGGYRFQLPVSLGSIKPETILVQLFADGIEGGNPEIVEMKNEAQQKEGDYMYHAQLMTSRPASDFTARAIPNYEGISVPLEDHMISWQY